MNQHQKIKTLIPYISRYQKIIFNNKKLVSACDAQIRGPPRHRCCRGPPPRRIPPPRGVSPLHTEVLMVHRFSAEEVRLHEGLLRCQPKKLAARGKRMDLPRGSSRASHRGAACPARSTCSTGGRPPSRSQSCERSTASTNSVAAVDREAPSDSTSLVKTIRAICAQVDSPAFLRLVVARWKEVGALRTDDRLGSMNNAD
jgi:hypothetical protein